MNVYLMRTSEEEMKKDFEKLEPFKQGVLTGMYWMLEDMENVELDLQFDKESNSTLGKIKVEIMQEFLKEVKDRMKDMLLDYLTSYVDYYYSKNEE